MTDFDLQKYSCGSTQYIAVYVQVERFFCFRFILKQILDSDPQPLLHRGVLPLQRADDGIQTKADDTLTYIIMVERTHLTWYMANIVDFGIGQCSAHYSILMSKSFYLSESVSSSIKWKDNNRMK